MKGSFFNLLNGATALVVVTAATMFLLGYPFRSTTAVKIYFLNYTNQATDRRAAVLCATNQANEAVAFNPYAYEISAAGNPRWMEFLSPPLSALPAHAAQTFTLPMFIIATNWQATLDWQYQITIAFENFREQVKFNLKINWKAVRLGQRPHYFRGPILVSHTAASPMITNTDRFGSFPP